MPTSDSTASMLPRLPDSAARPDAVGSIRARDRDAERAHLKQLAMEFEAMLMNEMLTDWRRSLMSGEETSDPGGLGTMTDMVGSEFGRALSRSGGLGIAAVLLRAFERQQRVEGERAAGSSPGASGPITGEDVNGQAANGQVVPIGGGVAPDRGPSRATAGNAAIAEVVGRTMTAFTGQAASPTGRVTSAFGWREDPLSGRAAFHNGVDVRMAYGEPVSSLAAGRVSFAGEQRGYGLTVVIDHADGLQTRYAHLSGTDVQPGDEVRRGQAIARSGNSGRATGPHLHVELLRQGRPVDPAGLLKQVAAGADLLTYRSALSERSDE